MSSSRRRPERRLSISQGRDAREIQLPPSAGKCFLLTSPFIERQRNPTAPVGGEVFSLDIPFHRTDETHYFWKVADVRLPPAISARPRAPRKPCLSSRPLGWRRRGAVCRVCGEGRQSIAARELSSRWQNLKLDHRHWSGQET